MGASRNSLSRRGRALREQVVVGACPACGAARVVMPCVNAPCSGFTWACECDADAESETSYARGGRCEACSTLPSEAGDPWDPLRHRHPQAARGTHRGDLRLRRVMLVASVRRTSRARKGGA